MLVLQDLESIIQNVGRDLLAVAIGKKSWQLQFLVQHRTPEMLVKRWTSPSNPSYGVTHNPTSSFIPS